MLFSSYLRIDPDPVLRTPARPVENFDKHLIGKIEQMEEIRLAFNGVGLAAQQAGFLDAIAIIEELGVVINPQIHPLDNQTSIDYEGCLSLPGIHVPVTRNDNLTLTGQAVDGQSIEHQLTGRLARIAQHEYDHLQGVLIIDRLTAEERRTLLY